MGPEPSCGGLRLSALGREIIADFGSDYLRRAHIPETQTSTARSKAAKPSDWGEAGIELRIGLSGATRPENSDASSLPEKRAFSLLSSD